MVRLYKTLLRPNMAYCVLFRKPNYRKVFNKVEIVQRKFTRMLPGLEILSYGNRLNG